MKTHKITRKQAKEILNYFKPCSKWKEKITQAIIDSETTNIIVSNELLLEGYNEANDTQKKLIEKYFKIEKPIDISNKYNTWAKIVKKLGEKECKLPHSNPKTIEEKSENAKRMLSRIIRVYNDGWIADWNNSNEYKYFIYLSFPVHGGLAAFHACAWSSNAAGSSVDLAIKDRKTAEIIIKNFPGILKDYFMK